jgi:hypothetical protein
MYLYWRAAVRRWIFGIDPSQAYSGDDPTQIVAFAGGSFTDPVPPVTTSSLQTKWRQEASNITVEVTIRGVAEMRNTRELELDIAEGMEPDAAASVEAPVDLPAKLQEVRTWLLRAERGGQYFATNEYGFEGFPLRWYNFFTVTPAFTASSALVPLTLTFQQETSLPAKNFATFVLSAPAPIFFPGDCFSPAQVALQNQQENLKLFDSCSGGGTEARLATQRPLNIKGFNLTVELRVTLSVTTPRGSNTWTLATFVDDSAVPNGFGTAPGFSVTVMPASLKGCNQITAEAPAYFSFTPMSAISLGSQIIIEPPPDQGFISSCFGLGAIPRPPDCFQRPGEDTLTFTLAEGVGAAEWAANVVHTLSFGLTNAPRAVPDVINVWKITILDPSGDVKESNKEVIGMELSASRLSVPNTIVYTSNQGLSSSSTATILVAAEKDIAAGSYMDFRITPPAAFEISGVKASPSLPVDVDTTDGSFSSVRLVLPNDAVILRGTHRITVEGQIVAPPQNLGAFQAVDPSWLFQAFNAEGKAQYQKVLSSTQDDPMFMALSDRGVI